MKKLLIPVLIIITFVIAIPATSLARNNHGYYKGSHHRNYNHGPRYRRNYYYRPYAYHPRPYGYYGYVPYYRPIYRPYYPVFPAPLYFGIVIN